MFASSKFEFALLLLGISLPAHAAPTCHSLTLTVTAKDQGSEIEVPPLRPDNPDAITDTVSSVLGNVGRVWPVVTVGGTYDISATYCEPETSVPERADTLQLLVHGATYTKDYFTGFGLPEDQAKRYSWVDYASKEGSATLSIDRLGAGQSSRPDPILEVQTNLEAEINHQIAKLVRYGKAAGRKFTKVIYVGHSLGSLIGSVSARRHPADFDALVLTGWSTDGVGGLARLLPAVPFPAALAKPKEFAGLPLGYLVFTVKEAVRRIFFGADGTFDPALQERDWRRRNTCTLSELLTAFNGVTPVAEYDRPVHVVIGDSDALFCPNVQCKPGPENTPGDGVHSFPSSSNYTYTVIPDTGHILNLHYTAQDTFKAAHEFMRYNIG